MTNEDYQAITGFENIDSFLYDTMSFIGEHWVSLLLLGYLVGWFVYQAIKKKVAFQKRAVRADWRMLRRKARKLPAKLWLKFGVIGGGYHTIKGDIYLWESRYEEILTEIKENKTVTGKIASIEKEKEDLEKEIKNDEKLLKSLKIEDEKHKSINQGVTDLKIKVNNLEKELESWKDVESKLKKGDVTKRVKTETYVAVVPTKEGGHLVSVRMNDLNEHESLLSRASVTKLAQLDISSAINVYRYYLFLFGLYILMLTFIILTDTPPDFLFKYENIPFLIMVLLPPLIQMQLMMKEDAYALTCSAKELPREPFKFIEPQDKKSLTITLPIYRLRIHWNEAINIENMLDIDTNSLAEAINNDMWNQVTKLSTDKANLESEVEFLTTVINQKDKKINEMEKKVEDSYFDGLYDNITTKAILTNEEDEDRKAQAKQQKQRLEGLTKLGVVAIIVFGIIACIMLILNSVEPSFESSIDLTTVAIAGILILVGGIISIIIITRILPRT